MEKAIALAVNYLFILFDKNICYPENAAKLMAMVIKKSIELLYPKENNHVHMRREWTVKFCAYLSDSLDEIIEENKE